MGIVGISFGSPTGGTGFDVNATVSQIVANLRNIETPWKNQLSNLTSQDTVLSQIGSDLSTLASDLSALTDPQGILSGKSGTSSNNDILSLTSATSAAVAGSHTVVVSQLAQTASQVSDPIQADGDTLSGTLTINGKTLNIDSADNDTTLSTLVKAINSGSFGVTASVITDASGSRLSLVSNTSGSAGSFTVSDSLQDTTASTTITFTQGQAAQDAKLTVDGVSITSGSNTISGAIPGVTFQILSADKNTDIQVQITNDTSDAANAINKLVSDYNKVASDINSQETKDSSGNAAPLFGSPMIASLQEQLQSALNFVQSTGAITSLSQLGISFSQNDDGTLTLDGDALSAALNNNFQDVINFFESGTGSTSFGDNLTSILNGLGNDHPNGLIGLAQSENSTEEDQLNTNISNEEATIATQQTNLTAELNQANFILTQIPQQLRSLDEIFSAITGFNENPQG